MWRSTLTALIVMLAACAANHVQQLPAQSNLRVQTETKTNGATRAEPQELIVAGRVVGKRIKTVPGMVCLVCNKPISGDDFVFLVKGQRVAVHRANCYARLLDRPYGFLEILQPHGAFLGAGAEEQTVSFTWFLVGLYILTGLVFAALGAHRALHVGRSPAAWFALGLTFNIFAYLLLLTRRKGQMEGPASVPPGLRKVPVTSDPRSCPECGKANHPSAEQCAGCGAKLQPSSESEVKKAGF
jgi:hypothetical protein